MKKRTSNIVVYILAVLGLLLMIPLSVNVYKDTHDPFKVLARQYKIHYYYIVEGELHDQVELSSSYKRVFDGTVPFGSSKEVKK